MFQDLFTQLTTFVSGLEPWQQVLALIPAGAIPFIESYLGSFLGSVVGVHPALAIPAAVLGNLLATLGLTALAVRARRAVTARVGGGTQPSTAPKESRFRQKVAAALDRYGVPGVCLLGPIIVASQITAPTLIALGASTGRVYLWMTVSIILWGLVFGLFGGAVATVV